LEWTITPTY